MFSINYRIANRCKNVILLVILLFNSLFCIGQSNDEEKFSIKITEGAFNIINRDFPEHQEKIKPVVIELAGRGKVQLKAFDIWNNKINWERTVDLDQQSTINFDYDLGYYRLEAWQAGKKVAVADLGIVPPFYEGVRPRSFFCSNTSHIRTGKELELLQRIGMKVQRVHIASAGSGRTKKATILDTLKQYDNWILPIVGYALGEKSEWAKKYNQHGPPADFSYFVSEWEKIVRDFSEVKVWEFWNEPWIFGWTWADTPFRYRELQTLWSNMALKIIPEAEIIVGNSWMFTMDHIKPYPYSWKNGLIQGTSHHPYIDNAALNWRSGAYQRALDATYLLNESMQLPFAYITEGGSSVASPDFDHLHHSEFESPNNILNAAKVPQLFTYNALAGIYQANMQWGIGYGADWTMSNTTFGIYTHFTEDRPVLVDIWPENELLTGAIFANPKFVTEEVKKLPRADEIKARWEVSIPQSRKNDQTKVAVLWSLTGTDNFNLDKDGQIIIENANGLKAFDMVASQILPENGRLILPLGQYPVYLVTNQLSIMEMYERIKKATILKVTPVNVYATSFTKDPSKPQKLRVRCKNQINNELELQLTLKSNGLKEAVSKKEILPAAELTDVLVDWPGVPVSPDNLYEVVFDGTYSLNGKKERFIQKQTLQQAVFANKAIQIDGDSKDWSEVVPVTLHVVSEADEAKYLLNPHLSPAEIKQETATAKLFTAYDDHYVYLCLKGWGHETTIGTEARTGLSLWKKGLPDGLDYPADCGDVLQISFGFRERVPHIGRQLNDPFAWKGHYYDTDYQYAIYKDADGEDHVMRQWGPDTDRRIAYQIDLVPYVTQPDGVRVVITDDCYEMAIPRSELKLFDPNSKSFRFDFLLNGKFQWARALGVFDFWKSNGSYAPSWKVTRPCQDYFGIEN